MSDKKNSFQTMLKLTDGEVVDAIGDLLERDVKQKLVNMYNSAESRIISLQTAIQNRYMRMKRSHTLDVAGILADRAQIRAYVESQQTIIEEYESVFDETFPIPI